jgi:hypothetical protein
MFIDASGDGDVGKDFVFTEGRIIPVYYYYPGEWRGYVLRCQGEQQESLPNIEGGFKILLSVRGAEVGRLRKALRAIQEKVGALEEIPLAFWPQLGMLTPQRSFGVYMVQELYLVTIQKCSLLEDLKACEKTQ